MSSETHQQLPESDEKQLCTSCMTPNEPTVHFCIKCGVPLSSFATFAPFERLFAEGFIYRQAADNPRRLIVVLGVWLIFSAMALGGIALVAISLDSSFVLAIVGAFMLVISLVIIWKTTRNYLARKQIAKKDDD